LLLLSGSNAVSAVYITACSEASAVKEYKNYKNKEWSWKADPFFTIALEEIDAIVKNTEKDLFVRQDVDINYRLFFRLQMVYIFLWTIIERYATLKYYLGGNSKKKRLKIADDPLFKKYLKKYVKKQSSPLRVYTSDRNFKFFELDSDNPIESIEYYYTIRSNSVHRGKSINWDYDRLKSALTDLQKIFKNMLEESWETSKINEN